MITAYEATSDALRRLEDVLVATRAVAVPQGLVSSDPYVRGMDATFELAIRAIKTEQETAQRMYAPWGSQVEQYLFMRLHTPVRKA